MNTVQKSQPLVYNGYAGALASFVSTGDPNAHKVTNNSIVGVPSVSSDKQFVVQAGGFKQDEIKTFQQRCEFWQTQGAKIPM